MDGGISNSTTEDKMSCQRLTPQTTANLLDSVDAFLFDCDGVIWKGDALIDGVSDTLDTLRALEDGKKTVQLRPNYLFEHDKSVGAVVVGLDQYINYYKLQFNIPTSRMCMVGDRLDTDILFGQNAGCRTLLVLSGVTNISDLQDSNNHIRPEYFTDKVSDIIRLFNNCV
ncbi:UNVERIFIED_CONTAM: Phosphoglycolate phosphatase 2 [Sesamum calycinum]|uniref:Phosphoglycolate phosphatase 2 n=1 Tax=Sesamum calycinum TaxID=2727403 RepID=A0AAW2Q5S2_9LAMI